MNFSVYQKGRKVAGSIPAERFSDEFIGIFEGLKFYHGRIFREKDHLERFAESAQTSGFKGKIDLKKVHRELTLAIQGYLKETGGQNRNQEGFIRLNQWQDEIFVMIGRRKHAQGLYEKGVRLKTSPVRRSLSNAAFPEAKTTAYQDAVLASLEPNPEEVYEWLFLNQAGCVSEVRIGNIFIVKEKVLKTPPTPGILNGVTRRFVIKWARKSSLEVREGPLMRHDIYQAEEAFLTNTSWDILPIAELDHRKVGTKVPGPITTQLQKIFKAKFLEECR